MPILLMLLSVQAPYFLFFAQYQALKNPNRLYGQGFVVSHSIKAILNELLMTNRYYF